MPLRKYVFKPGVNQENTRYTNEGGWYYCDKIRFRQGTPEKIGGWQQISPNTYLGVCRSLWPWMTLDGVKYVGMGTNARYYVMNGGQYYNITPIDTVNSTTLTNPFTTFSGSNIVQVLAPSHGRTTGDNVSFSPSRTVGGITISGVYQLAAVTPDIYTITGSTTASSSATGGGSVTVQYQIAGGNAIQSPLRGFGSGTWGSGVWGTGTPTTSSIRIWNAQNFGEDLIYGYVGGPMYYWVSSAANAKYTPGVLLNNRPGADAYVPLMQNTFLVSDSSRFVIAFGVNDYDSVIQDPMLIRWSDQENSVLWFPQATNQAGSVRLSHGSKIITAVQVRQEILVFTDVSLYSMQYLGPPAVWGVQLLSDNISIASNRAAIAVAGVTYWMGDDKFYMYDGRTQTMPCDLRQLVFQDFNTEQVGQVFATSVEKFNEVWWFYCSQNSNTNDRYVVYNYLEKVWYYGTMSRTAWLDASIITNYPLSAFNQRLLYQEIGYDDVSTGTPVPIQSYITSSEFDIDDGHDFGFVWRVIPDITFRGSTVDQPKVTFTLLPLQNSGSGYNNPQSVAGSSNGAVVRSASVPVEKFTGQVNIRVRGRQMSLKVESNDLGVAWQLGAPRLDIRPDGRKS
jgi:hypothetical protein